ncbi:MAG: Lrp/AsnC family transcriptional regulator [bacterium]|nr:Lrp/AsnC family transcriptional regulator [bacterium]
MNKEILKVLQQNARIDLNDLAVMVNLPVEQVKKEIEEMEKNKIICGYHALINFDNTDDEVVSALIEVKVTPQRGLGFDKIAERIYNFPEVSSVFLMSGAFDFTVILEAKTMKEISKFVFEKLATLDYVQSTATHFILRKYKDFKTVLVEEKKDLREMVNL